MTGRAAVAGAATAGLLVLAPAPPPAEACSPPPPPVGDPCTRLRLIVPGASFPQDLYDEVRLGLYEHDGYADSQAEEFDLEVLPLVARATDDGYEDASFELVEDDNLVPHARILRLDEPLPGDYIVSWEDDDSCSDEPSPDGRGSLIGELTITESAPVPEALGAASSPGQEIVEKTYHMGTDAACEDITVDAIVARHRVEVALADDVLPWPPSAWPTSPASSRRSQTSRSTAPVAVTADATRAPAVGRTAAEAVSAAQWRVDRSRGRGWRSPCSYSGRCSGAGARRRADRTDQPRLESGVCPAVLSPLAARPGAPAGRRSR